MQHGSLYDIGYRFHFWFNETKHTLRSFLQMLIKKILFNITLTHSPQKTTGYLLVKDHDFNTFQRILVELNQY
jgi:hypothetical protein